MSHTTTIKTVPIKDISALRQAAERIRARGTPCELVENARPRMYFRQQEVMCDFVLKLTSGKYDVGFQRQEDGSYAPIFDDHANYVGSQLAVKACRLPMSHEEHTLKHIGILSQEYARCSAVNAAAAQGFYVESEFLDEQGNYQLAFAN